MAKTKNSYLCHVTKIVSISMNWQDKNVLSLVENPARILPQDPERSWQDPERSWQDPAKSVRIYSVGSYKILDRILKNPVGPFEDFYDSKCIPSILQDL